MDRRHLLRAIILAFALTTIARSSGAQAIPEGSIDFGAAVAQATAAPATPRHTGVRAMLRGFVEDVKHLPSRENLVWAGIGGGLALAVHPLDARVKRQVVGNAVADNIFQPGRYLGGVAPIVGSVALYAYGRSTDQPRVSHVGMDLIRAQAVAQLLTQTIKYTVRRERPDQSSRNSFPSGHAATTFAVATVIERHLSWRYSVPAYAFASYVAASRLPAGRHWLSDVVFGAAVGIIAGRTSTSDEANPYPVAVVAVPGGAAVLFSRQGWPNHR